MTVFTSAARRRPVALEGPPPLGRAQVSSPLPRPSAATGPPPRRPAAGLAGRARRPVPPLPRPPPHTKACAARGVAGCGSSLTLTAEIMAVSPTPRGSQSVLLSLTDTVRRPAPRLWGTGRS